MYTYHKIESGNEFLSGDIPRGQACRGEEMTYHPVPLPKIVNTRLMSIIMLYMHIESPIVVTQGLLVKKCSSCQLHLYGNV